MTSKVCKSRFMFLVPALLTSMLNNVAGAAHPGELLEWKVSPNSQVVIRLRYCPRGTIRPGKPSVRPISPENTPQKIDVRDFYIGETEITVGQFRAVVGEAGMAPLLEQAEKVKQTNPILFDALQSGQNEPAIFVGLDDAIDFCNYLQEKVDEARKQDAQPSIESRVFRLPSHVEWQYAARAISNAEDQSTRPHFMRWIKFAELSPTSQEKCREVWLSLGHAEEFPDTQDAFLELTRWTESSQGEKVSQILTEAFEKAFGSPRRSPSGIGTLAPVGGTAANDWNLTDVHEGVSEWTMWSSRYDRTIEMWQRFTTARKVGTTLAGNEEFFLCGGSLGDSYLGTNALNRFTLWGGPKLSGDQPQPIAYNPDLVLNNMPGFRIVMERSMSRDWMQLLRKSVFSNRQLSPSTIDYVRLCRPIVEELTEVNHPSRVAIDFYNELASRTKPQGKLVEVLQRAAKMESKSGGQSSAVNKLSLLVSKPTPEKISSGTGSDDAEYFQLLAALVEP